jgi:MYXO-CTERM domain-containing protein
MLSRRTALPNLLALAWSSVALLCLAVPQASAFVVSGDFTLTPTLMINGPVGGITSVPAAPIGVHVSFEVTRNGVHRQDTNSAEVLDFEAIFPGVTFDEDDVRSFTLFVQNGVLLNLGIGTPGGAGLTTLIMNWALNPISSQNIFFLLDGPSQCSSNLGAIAANGPCAVGPITLGLPPVVDEVAEPGAAGLAILGVVALAARRRRRRAP